MFLRWLCPRCHRDQKTVRRYERHVRRPCYPELPPKAARPGRHDARQLPARSGLIGTGERGPAGRGPV